MKALVIGDVMLDEYWLGDTHRISPEAPVPIIKITDENFKLGGAGNVAANLAYLGIDVTLVGLIGIDKEAKY
jgi:D-beta-D-heptose 7-phosphate kinase/D-beta-D-heptose 1-phosphate adenosyltransferase